MVLHTERKDAMIGGRSYRKEDNDSLDSSLSNLEIAGDMDVAQNQSSKISLSISSLSNDIQAQTNIKDLHKKMSQLREKAYTVIEKISSLSNLNGDVEDYEQEYALMKEMEHINEELANVNILMNSAANKYELDCQRSSECNSQSIILDLMLDQHDDNDDPIIAERSSCRKLCDQILFENQLLSSGRCSQIEIERKSEINVKMPRNLPRAKKCNKENKNHLKNKPQQANKKKKNKINNLTEHKSSSNLGHCERYNSGQKISLSGVLKESYDVDNIIKENEILKQKINNFEKELEALKNEAASYKNLLTKEKELRPKKLNSNLCKIKNILDSSAALPPFQETIEVLKALCLLLLNNLNKVQSEENDDKQETKQDAPVENPKETVENVKKNEVIIAAGLADNETSSNNECKNSLFVDSSAILSMQSSSEILKTIEDLAVETKENQEPTENIQTTKNISKITEDFASCCIGKTTKTTTTCLAPPTKIDCIQFLKKLEKNPNLQVFVQQIPKKLNSTMQCNEQNADCKHVYLVFV